ncbi:MAG: hypothetical protein C0177_06695 [Fervidicoccus fontis]|nr:MAG: hypothetical protein C0177_06695 [Fervidicoccus fontis]
MYKPMRSNRNVVRKLFKLSSRALKESLDIKVAKNSKYMNEDIVKSLIYVSLNNTSAESGSKDLAKDMDVPSPDVVLRRLKALDLSNVINALNKANMKLVKKHARDGMKMAIDYTEEPYYGKIDMYVTRNKYKSGADVFHTFATISVVGKVERERLTLYSLPVTRLDTKEEIVRELLKNSPRPSLLLMDRGFFTIEIIKLLTEMGIKFIIPAVRNERVKRVIDDYIHGMMPAVFEYEMGSKVYMVIAKKRNAKEDDRPVDKYIPLVTNVKFDDPQEMVAVIPEEYRYRWEIETSYRVEDGFETKTTSRNFTLRVIYFMVGYILYNSWIIAEAETIKYREITAYVFRKTIES